MKSELNFKIIKDGQTFDMHELGIWVESFHIHSPNISRSKLNVPGMIGAHLASTEEGERQVSIGMQIETDSMLEFDQLKHQIYDLFYSVESFSIVRDLTPDQEIFVFQEGEYDIDNITPEDGKFGLTLTMLDPYKYGKEKTKEFASDAGIITNEGTAEAEPIFELEVLAPVTFALIQNQHGEYMLIGTPVDVTSEVVDTKTLLLEERGQTLDTWDTASDSIDNGYVDGTFGTDNDGITVPSYGEDTTEKDWHGPGLIKEVPVAQDFEVEAMVQGRTTETSQTFRIEVYLFDEGMNELGKMAIKDDTLGIHRKKGEGRLGPYVGANENYLISSQNYSYDQDYFYGMLRIRRVGKEIMFYITRVNSSGRHVQTILRKFIDNENRYAGKLKYIQIHIGKFADTDRAYAPKIDHIKVFQLAQVTVDQTPYIADVDDIITFDHVNEEILINGEARNDLKAFGGLFFTLKKGENHLITHPANSFRTTGRYRSKNR
ncbi:phage tail domain-containing protein [Virgibacillus salexigens]|uniref:phage tail domain-containing protein n=1 Tax=Virgibacillus salexigens TaxID=61016 RepID=UPI003081B099